jgi:hypothetical protein
VVDGAGGAVGADSALIEIPRGSTEAYWLGAPVELNGDFF